MDKKKINNVEESINSSKRNIIEKKSKQKQSESTETIAEMNDAKLINKSFKNVHIKPADEQEFENNI